MGTIEADTAFGHLMKARLAVAAFVGVCSVTLVVLLWQGMLSDSSGARAPTTDDAVTILRMESYRGPLPADLSPADWLPSYPTVALVKIESIGESKWSGSGGVPGDFLYTTTTVSVQEVFKGSLDDEPLGFHGGRVGNTRMDPFFELAAGDQAVVFVLPPAGTVDALLIDNAYVVDSDGMATSTLDQRELPLDELTAALREVATREIP